MPAIPQKKNRLNLTDLPEKTFLLGKNPAKKNLRNQLSPQPLPLNLKEIYTLLDLEDGACLIFKKDTVMLVNLPADKALLQACSENYYLNYPAYKRTISKLLRRIGYKIPLAYAEFVLFPLTSGSGTIWVNPAHVDDVTDSGISTFLTLTNQLKFELPIKTRSFTALAENAIILQTNIKRAYDPHTKFTIDDLHSYLGVEHTDFTNRLIKNLPIEDHLLARGTFHRLFEDELFRQKYYQGHLFYPEEGPYCDNA